MIEAKDMYPEVEIKKYKEGSDDYKYCKKLIDEYNLDDEDNGDS